MALTKEAIQNTYPLPIYNYKVTIGSETLSFSEVSGLSMSYEKVVYKHGFSFATGPLIIRAQPNEVSLTLKRGVVTKRSQLYTWFTANEIRDLFIDLCDEKGLAVVRWKVSKALPLKIEAPSFSAEGNSVAVESLELIAKELSIEYF